jgi:hypothetical protein
LTGFRLEIVESPPCLRVYLDWPNNWSSSRAFTLLNLELSRDPRAITFGLESLAAEARERAERIADPGRPPG